MSELLAPAGTLEHLKHAYAFGADACYSGMPRYGLRVRENHFNKLANLEEAINYTHKLNKKIYITANIFPHNSKIKTFIKDLTPLVSMRPDALIMADPGLIYLAREQWPDMPIHLSVQANTVNYAAVKFWASLGIERIILSRELSIDEIAEIKQLCPEVELEVFVHGALCMAHSGRCLLSGFINHRDANQGTCTNACRWEYKEVNSTIGDNGDLKAIPDIKAVNLLKSNSNVPQKILIEEVGRPGESIQVEEDENGTYFMNSKDLRAVEHVQKLIDIGVNSLKIEGRTKSIYYVSRVVQSYRKAINDAMDNKPLDTNLLANLDNLANRGYTDGFFQRHHDKDYQNYLDGNSQSKKQQYVAQITGYDKKNKMIEFISKNKMTLGDKLEIILPSGNINLTLTHMKNMHDKSLEIIPGGGVKAKIPFENSNVEFGLITKNL